MKKDFRNTQLSIEERTEILLGELTTDEKLGMVNFRNAGVPRLGIPAYNWWNEALHGVARSGTATVFPQAIAMAATFSTELVKKMGEVIAIEGNARFAKSQKHKDYGTYKGLTYWSPNVNIFRDPRWGRGHETYGECPFLTGELGAAFVQGLQGDDLEHVKAIATPKHFAVHSGPEKTRLEFNSVVNKKDLYETYLPAFKKCIDAGALSIMSAYNAINGIPCSCNSYLLEDILRKEWNFNGVVVSDGGAGAALVEYHHYVDDYVSALAVETKNGVDVINDWEYCAREAYDKGVLTDETLDKIIRRQLNAKMRLGLFDPKREEIPYSVIECKEHQRLALECAEKSIVLLKNKDNLLPLNKEKINAVAVIGPNADCREVLLGNYHGTPSKAVTFLAGIQDTFEDRCRIFYARGCEHYLEKTESFGEKGDRLCEAVSVAEEVDCVILFLGLNPQMEGEAGDAFNSDASGDKTDLELPAVQLELLQKVAQVGKPLILVNCSGSAIHIPEEYADAVLQVFYPGAYGGTALGKILTGEVCPSGKLPVTFYNSADDLPPLEDYSMQGRTYRFYEGSVQYPFGFGLSYTEFEYSNIEIKKDIESISVSAEIKNTGNYKGEELSQIYIACLEKFNEKVLKQLVGFKRVELNAGELKKVEFSLPIETFSLVNEKGEKVFVKGKWQISIGGNSEKNISEILEF